MTNSVLLSILLTLSRPDTSVLDTSALVLRNPSLYSIVVSRAGRVVYQGYFHGHEDTTLCNNQSLTKSIMSLLIGIAIDKGFIPSVDVPITRYFPALDSSKAHIRLRDIMNQASGLWHENLDIPSGIPTYLALPDPSDYVLSQPLLSEPGTVFHYNNAASHLMSVILTKATHMSTLDFARKYLFGPLGIQNVYWEKLNDGYYDGAGLLSVHLRTADINKIGQLILDNGRNIISPAWIDSILNPSITYPSPWGFHPSLYALCYYHYTYQGTPFTYGLGWGGQFLVIIPSKNTIININQDPTPPTAVRHSIQFTSALFPLIYQLYCQ